MTESVADDPRDIDLTMTGGSGLPLGPVAETRKIGHATIMSKLDDIQRKCSIDLFKPTETLRAGNIIV